MTKAEFKMQRGAMRLANNTVSQAIVAQREAIAAEVAVKFNAGMELLAQIHGEISPILCAKRDAEDFCFRARDTKTTPSYRDTLAAIRSRSVKHSQSKTDSDNASNDNDNAPIVPPVKRGRGRPPGSKNKKTLALEAALA